MAALGACHRQAPTAPAPPVAATGGEGLLGAVAGYVAGPLVEGDGWTRRRYVRAGATVEVTAAEQRMTAAEYGDWERQARDYPAARLGLASGFFTCAGDGGAGRCDLHVQTRAGQHLELAGGGNATRPDLEELFNGLRWK